MADKEDAAVLKALLPALGIGTAVIVVYALLVRTFALRRRVYSQDGQYLVSVRRSGWHDLRDFVQPDNPDVVALYSEIGPDAWALYDWVARNISYRLDIGELFLFPSETLARGAGDCEDTAILLTSLIRAGGDDCHVALGTLQGLGHAWVEHGGEIMETTYTSAQPVPDPEDYVAFVLFNEREVIELWPGALGEVFEVGRDEARELNLIAGAIRNEVPPECPSPWPFMAVGLVTGGILGTGFAMILQKGEYKD